MFEIEVVRFDAQDVIAASATLDNVFYITGLGSDKKAEGDKAYKIVYGGRDVTDEYPGGSTGIEGESFFEASIADADNANTAKDLADGGVRDGIYTYNQDKNKFVYTGQ